jgi:chromosome partitioning protein
VRVVCVLNQKGGVGKTTTAVNLGAGLTLRGRRVLLVDMDPQGNLTDHLGVDAEEGRPTMYEVLSDGAALLEAARPTETAGLDVVPADEDLAAAEVELVQALARETRLRRAIAALPPDRYDWILIDCPPSLGLLSINALAASDEVLVTLQTEYFALRGLGQIVNVVDLVRQNLNPALRIAGILPTLVNPVTNLAKEVLQEVRSHFGERVFGTSIRQSVRLAEAPGHRQHIFAYAPHSPGAQDYRALAEEVDVPARTASSAGEVGAPAGPPRPRTP